MLKRIWFSSSTCSLAASLAIASAQAQAPAPALDQPLAHATAFNATIFGYPLNGMYQRLMHEVLDPATRNAGFDQYFHFRQLATPEVAPFPAPNNDTPYSTAWVDLRREPAILAAPDTGGRYYTAQIVDMTTETIANIGQSNDGTKAGMFALVGPGWNGELPAGLRRVIRCDTAFAYVLLRILVEGADDVATVNALQDKFTIASLTRLKHGETGAVDEDPPPRFQAGQTNWPVHRYDYGRRLQGDHGPRDHPGDPVRSHRPSFMEWPAPPSGMVGSPERRACAG